MIACANNMERKNAPAIVFLKPGVEAIMRAICGDVLVRLMTPIIILGINMWILVLKIAIELSIWFIKLRR